MIYPNVSGWVPVVDLSGEDIDHELGELIRVAGRLGGGYVS
jgi:hypothetical protein